MKRHLCGSAFAFVVIAIFSGQAYAQLPTLVRTIDGPSPPSDSEFGFSFGSFNGNLLVGAPDFTDFSGGAAYLMDINTGAKLLTLTSPDANNGAILFGGSVAQVGQNIVVGDYEFESSSNRSGSAYVFSGSTGQLLFPIRNPNPQSSDFATSIAQIGGNIWINAQSNSTAPGKVYIFSPTNGNLIKTLTSPEPSFSGFGYKFIEHGNDVFVSALGGSFGNFHAGAIYRFDKNTLAVRQKIFSPAPNEEGYFGWALAQDNNRLLVGAPGYDSPKNDAIGRAFLFSEKTGALLQTFVNPEPQNFADFGKSLALAGNYAFIGGGGADLNPGGIGAQNIGAIYVFNATSGKYLGRVVNPQPGQNDEFTFGWGIDGGLIAIGDKLVAASYLHGNGAAYVFSIPQTLPNIVPIPEPSTIALLAMGGLALVWRRKRK